MPRLCPQYGARQGRASGAMGTSRPTAITPAWCTAHYPGGAMIARARHGSLLARRLASRLAPPRVATRHRAVRGLASSTR